VAVTFPDSLVTLVDIDQSALDTARRRVASLGQAVSSRVTICCCKIAEYSASDEVDCVLCLHGCGALTDEAIAQAVHHGAAFCCVPCCYSELLAPQSAALAGQEWLTTDAFQQLARAAEHPGGEVGPDVPVEYVVDTPVSRRAMCAIDSDRALRLQEVCPRHTTRLARLWPLSCSPKHNVLLGWVDAHPEREQRRRRTAAPGVDVGGFGSGVLLHDRSRAGRNARWRHGKASRSASSSSSSSSSSSTTAAAAAAAGGAVELVDGLPWC
jgi:hypothetical protein